MWPVIAACALALFAACALALFGWALYLLSRLAERIAERLAAHFALHDTRYAAETMAIYRASSGVILPPPPKVPREFLTDARSERNRDS